MTTSVTPVDDFFTIGRNLIIVLERKTASFVFAKFNVVSDVNGAAAI